MNRAPRHILLDTADYTGSVRFLSGLHVTLEDGKKTSWVTITRTGVFSDPRYGQFEITKPMLLSMVANFEKRVYGQDVFIDVAHEPSKGAAARIQKLSVEGDRLRALVEWTAYGVDAVKSKGYAYLSAEYHENWEDNEKHELHGPVLLGAGLTVRPVIKRLDPVQLSEASAGSVPTLIHPELQTRILQELQTMWKQLLKQLSDQLKSRKLADVVVATLVDTAEKALAGVTDEKAAKELIAAFETSGIQLSEQIGDKVVTLEVKLPPQAASLSAADVKKLMEDENKRVAEETKKLAETKAAKVKLLGDTIGAAKGLDDELKKKLTEEHQDLVTETMTDDQVKALAESQIRHGNELIASRTLAAMGYPGARGTVHITVDDSNAVKSLQESIDKRLGLIGLSDAKRYKATGGKLPEENRQFAEKVLAQYDAEHARDLRAEQKMLAAGDGKVSDVAVPAIFERTVIRESLYRLIGLQFVDVGTYPFSGSALIPYSFRDTTAAGRSNTRVYEGGPVPRAGVKQTSDTAYPIPQKLAFEVSDELRYLTGNGQLNWDSVIENVNNASRIIGEDSEKLIFDEVLNAADQYLTTAVVSEAVATGDGAKSTYKLAKFPVVRPKKIFDLQGNQVGSTLYPIVITTNGGARAEYDGTNTQGAGIYYTMDFNLGEIHFVSELGAPVLITNAHAIVCSYTYTSNVFAFDTDLGGDALDDHWTKFLYSYGLRKSVIENDRYYTPNFGLMSSTAMNAVEQAKQFAANFMRAGTDLQADGTLGRIKGVPNYNTTAPGLNMGDQRIIIGERGQTRFRMMKPWSMGEMQDQRDSNGRYVGKKEAYGDQFIVLHTPTPLKGATTSMLLYSSSLRVNRA